MALKLRHGIFKSRKEKLRDKTRRSSEENIFPEPDPGLVDGRYLREPVHACVSSFLHRLTDGATTEHAPWYRGGASEHCVLGSVLLNRCLDFVLLYRSISHQFIHINYSLQDSFKSFLILFCILGIKSRITCMVSTQSMIGLKCEPLSFNFFCGTISDSVFMRERA